MYTGVRQQPTAATQTEAALPSTPSLPSFLPRGVFSSSVLKLVLDLHNAHGRGGLLTVLRPVPLAEVDVVAAVNSAAPARHAEVRRRMPRYRLQASGTSR